MTQLEKVKNPRQAEMKTGFGRLSRLVGVFFVATVSLGLPMIALGQQTAETGTQTQVARVTRIKINRKEKTMNRPNPMHTHPGEEIIYVIEGTLEYEIGGKKSKVKAGDVLFVPAGTPHTATNIGSDNGAELATYVVEKGKPLITLVK